MRLKVVTLLALVVSVLALSSGVALAASIKCEGFSDCYGTPERDHLKGTGAPDRIYGLGKGDVLKGLGGSDELFGQDGNDVLLGGRGYDVLTGGLHEDTLSGGADPDTYYFDSRDWGRDRVIDTAVADSDPFSGNALVFCYEDCPYGTIPAGESLTIDLRPLPKGAPNVADASGANTVTWRGGVIDVVVVRVASDDKITGNPAANAIYAYGGNDTVRGKAGDDYIDVGDGSSGDRVSCGTGEDTVVYDPGDVVSDDCEVRQSPGP